MEMKIYKFDFGNEVKYFMPYATSDGIKLRGIVFGKVGFDNKQSFVSFVAEYSNEFVDSKPVVGTISVTEFVNFLMGKVENR